MAEVSRPADDDFRKVMALTGVDEATAKKVLEESGGDMTTTINKLLDDLEDDMGAPVVNQDNSFPDIEVIETAGEVKDAEVVVVEVIENAEEAAKGQVEEEAFQMVRSVTGKDDATVKRVLDEMGGDTTRAINRLLDLEAKVEVTVASKEPTIAQMKEVLVRNYSEKDEESLEVLCVRYEGKSAELEKYLEQHFKDIPTKMEVEQATARAGLEAELKSLQEAEVEEASTMAIEDCPGCHMPQMNYDTAAKVFHCQRCEKDFCRKCWKSVTTSGESEIKCLKCPAEVFEVINVLPKREFDEEDPMAVEFRKAESQFLRMQAKAKGRFTNLEIQSVDVVTNIKLKERFEAKKNQLVKTEGDVKSLLLFHGTPQQNVLSILQNNFDTNKVANGRAYGDGVYFSEQPEVSLGYSAKAPAARGKKRKRDENANEEATISLILCQVLLSKNVREVKHPGFSTCWAVVVPDVDQILPRYVLHLRNAGK